MTTTAIPDLWDDHVAASLSEPGLLLYRSNLLGSDLRITNFGGGNTSAKVRMTDPLTRKEETVLWVKGSGGDLGSMKLDGFSTLYLDKLHALKGLYRGIAHEDEMVDYLPHCTFNLNPRAASIDTPLHGFVPALHVDHMHADAVIAIAAARDSEQLTREIFGEEMGYLPWQRPGFDLGLKLGEMAERNPHFVGVVLGAHGLFTWGKTGKESYQTTLRIINKAAQWLEEHRAKPAFKGARLQSLDARARGEAAKRLMPEIRGRISKDERKVGHFTDAPEVLEFVNGNALDALAPLGTSCPDHFLRTKIRPLVLPFEPERNNLDQVISGLDGTLAAYRNDYAAYYERCKHANSPKMRDANAVIYLVPGVGMLSFAKDKATARIASEFYINAINVMRGASGVSRLCRACPSRKPSTSNTGCSRKRSCSACRSPKALPAASLSSPAVRAASGRRSPHRLLSEGACVVLADIDAGGAQGDGRGFRYAFRQGPGAGACPGRHSGGRRHRARSSEAVLRYGGVDIVVNNAGISSAAPVEDTTLELWNKNMSILGTGYFLVAREGYRLMKKQGLGGSMVFIGSKNAIAASAGASAYCTAKAAEMHLARCMALEGAPLGIRVNVVNPGCGAARLQNLAGRMAPAARAVQQDQGRRARGILPQALLAAALGLS